MNINEAALYLKFSKDNVRIAINTGIQLPKSHRIIKLNANEIGNDFDIEDSDLDYFIGQFEKEDPGRHPPVAVCRNLLVEARHGCAICEQNSAIEFHHIIDFHELSHYDPNHMIALCPNHHALCTKGTIDKKAQYMYKRRLKNQKSADPSFLYSIGPANFSWADLKQVIKSLYELVVKNEVSISSGFDFTEIDITKKNELNRLGEDYFNSVILSHQPYFGRIQDFLSDPINSEIVEIYYQVVDEIKTKISVYRTEGERFEYFLTLFADEAVKDQAIDRGKNHRTLNILLSFMYVNCDIGRKK